MRTIFDENKITVSRSRNRTPGELYHINDPEDTRLDFTYGVSDDALLAVLLDRAKLADDRKRVTAIKALKSGDDERGKAKRGPGRPKNDA